MSIYIAHRRKNNASNAPNVPSTVQKETSSVYDEISQFACSAHANCFGTSSMSLVQRQRRFDGGMCQAETVEQRVDGGWRNEDEVCVCVFVCVGDWLCKLDVLGPCGCI